MGCVMSKSLGLFGIRHESPDSTHLGGRTANGHPIELISPDPDLGWRHLPAQEIPRHTGYPASTIISTKDTKDWCSSNENQNGQSSQQSPYQHSLTYPLPGAWSVHFFNDRSGNFCQVSLVTLALNISIRAERLAQAFGILNDNNTDIPTSIPPPPSSSSILLPKLHAETFLIRRPIYVALGIPDFVWKLLQRADYLQHDTLNPTRSPLTTGIKKREHKLNGHALQGTPQLILQRLQRGPHGKQIWADVPAIGMNIAEQLHRLERKQDNRHFLPTDLFGWKYIPNNHLQQTDFEVISPKGETIEIVPEEMIMNATQWVQQTYLTSTLF